MFSVFVPSCNGNRTKINKWEYTELKTFCTSKETVNKMERQPTEWEKIFASDVPDKG